MYPIEIEYLGLIESKFAETLEQAVELAENAVYEMGASWSCVYNQDMTIYCEYEI